MAINNQQINTNIDKQDYSNPYNDALAKALGSSISSGVDSGLKRSNQSAESAQQGNNQRSLEKLKSLLTGQQTDKDVKTASDLSDANGGRSVRVGDTSIGVDPMAQMAKTTQKNNIAAVTGLQKTYNAGSKGLQDTLDATQTGLNALQSNDASSLGQLRAAMLSANGFKRFNEPEALANAPDSTKSEVASLLNKYGLDTPGGNLSDIQRQNAAKFFTGKLDEISQRHNVAKQQALGQYAQNPGSDPTRLPDLQNTLGAPLDAQISSTKQKLSDFQKQAIPQAPTQGSNAPSQGILQQAGNALSKFFGGGQSAPQAPQPPAAPPTINVQHSMAPAQSAAMNAPSGFDPDAFLKGQ